MSNHEILSSNIPAARAELKAEIDRIDKARAALSGCDGFDTLDEAIEHCVRTLEEVTARLSASVLPKLTRTVRAGPRKTISRSLVKNPALAREIAGDLWAQLATYSADTQMQVGLRHGVNGARISEMLRGRYDKMLPPELRFAGRDHQFLTRQPSLLEEAA